MDNYNQNFDRIFEVPDGMIVWPKRHCFEVFLEFIKTRRYSFDDVVFGFDSVGLSLNGKKPDQLLHFFISILSEFDPKNKKHSQKGKKAVTIPIYYDLKAPDLLLLSESLMIAPEEVIKLHVASSYKVSMIGFLPGFVYLTGMDERIIHPRKSQPSVQIAPGSIGIGGIFTGIYPIQSPGGWYIIGRCPLKLFDPKQLPPNTLEIGDAVVLEAISKQHFDKINVHG